MFSDAIVLEIRRLLDEGGLSWRAIARQVGVSRGFVSNVAKGVRGVQSTPFTEPCPRRGDPADSLPSRCHGCGGMVYKPCRLCRTRAHQRRMRLIRGISGLHPPDGPVPRRVA